MNTDTIAKPRIVRRSLPNADRYRYDRACRPDNGWAKLLTWQDASYFGVWLNPTTREILSFAEGDVTHVTHQTDAAFALALADALKFYDDPHQRAFIDVAPAPSPVRAKLDRLGFTARFANI